MLNTTNHTILIVDDDREIIRLVRSYLENASFTVWEANDGETALHILRGERPDLLILDLMLPNIDGLDIARHIRNDPNLRKTPIIMLTARITDTDKILGLELGADDYITKPFNPQEVVARVRAVLRRANPDWNVNAVLKHGGIVLDEERRTVSIEEEVVNLTPTEFNILKTLMQRPEVVFSRAELVEQALGYDYESLERTLDNHIRNLRKKIEPDANNPIYIKTVYGIGYRLEGN